jgi:hypothetical protein
VEWFGWIWNDLPTRVALVGSVVYAAAMPALVWWTSRHYVRSAATNWRWTSWEKAVDAEGGAASRQPARQSNGEAADERAWQEVT